MVTIRFPALDKEIQARVTLLGRTIDPANRTFEVEVSLPNNGGLLKPNLLAEMLLMDESIDEAVILPMYLVQQEVGGKQYVMVASDCSDGKCAKKKYVSTGSTYAGDIVITEGLEGDEEVLLEGALSVSEDELIDITSQS